MISNTILLIRLQKNNIKSSLYIYFIEYKYNISITIVNDKPTSLHALVDQSGFSFNSWNFQIDCRDYKFSNTEKIEAKKLKPKMPKYLEEFLKKHKKSELIKKKEIVKNKEK